MEAPAGSLQGCASGEPARCHSCLGTTGPLLSGKKMGASVSSAVPPSGPVTDASTSVAGADLTVGKGQQTGGCGPF